MIKPLPPLSDEQAQAVSRMRGFIADPSTEASYFVMHGLAGSGKTTTLATLAHEYPGAWICTLAAKAADVLRRKTGLATGTIHSAFYKLNSERKTQEGREVLDFGALHGEGDLSGNLVILDESSMIPEEMALDLLRTGVKIIASGDPGQLPPVKGQQFFARPDVELKKIHRQALDSPIIRQAHWVRLGRDYAPDGDAFRVEPRITRDELLQADVVICWRNKTRQAINEIVRKARGHTAPHPVAGEPVMCLKNVADLGLFNGGIYELARDFRDGDATIWLNLDGVEVKVELVRFEGMRDALQAWEKATTHFTYAYAITAHKSQGSEWPNVLLIDEYSMPDGRTPWLYTSITRAAERITVIRR